LAAETGGNLEAARQRYLFAAFFSAGLMMPMGYEYGFQKRLHVVKTRPEDWESPSYDLRDFIAQVNNMKRACPVLLEEGPQERLNPPGEPVVLLLKCRDQGPGRVLAVINTTRKFQKTMLKALGNWLGGPPEAWQELTPLAKPLRLTPTQEITLSPSDIRLFYNPVAPPGLIGKT
jgi:starch synthase (maltosyl-transferring)